MHPSDDSATTVTRPRRVVLVVGVVAALSWATASPPASAVPDLEHGVTATVASSLVGTSVVAHRTPRPWPSTAAFIPPAAVVALSLGAPLPQLVASVFGGTRITEVGDDWRALLRGAPPAAS
jgi:hypothetical protein